MSITNGTEQRSHQVSEHPLTPLDDELIDGIAGGYIFNSDELNVFPASKPWEVIDGNGEVIARFESVNAAIDFAKQHGQSPQRLYWHELKKLRDTGSPW